VVLSDLKDTGKELKLGVLKRMLAAALPFGSEMQLRSTMRSLRPRIADSTIADWTIGPELKIDSLDLEPPEEETSGPANPKVHQKR